MGGVSIRIELDREGALAGGVVLANGRDGPVRFWNLGNSWGDETLSFEWFRAEPIRRIERRPQVYTRNVPSSAEVPPGGTHRLPFDLNDGTWDVDGPIDRPVGDGAQLVAIYEVPPTPEAVEHGVWVGRVRSAPVPLEDPGERADG